MPRWPIPSDYPLNELVGQEVTQVCMRSAEVHLSLCRQPQPGSPETWKPGARIDIEFSFTLVTRDSGPVRVEQQMFKVEGGRLATLLGERVEEVFREPADELRLEFSNGTSLRLHVDPQGFESFHLVVAGESITVMGA